MSVIQSVPGRAAAALREFLSLESAGGQLLIGAAVAGLVSANSPLSGLYGQLLALPLTVKLGAVGVDKPLLLWINDGLMAVFFLLVALELKREMLAGQFSDRRQIALPAACAAGGMLVPMAIYAALNRGDAHALPGFAIPAATDIAFALGVLGLLGSRVPVALKLLLTAIAVLDDLGAIVVIALFYTSELSWTSLVIALTAFAGLVALNRRGVTRIAPYVALGVVMWLAVLKSGVHATLAGVALGMTIPMRDPDDAEGSPLERLEHDLHPTVAWAILPLFAFANAGIALSGLSLAALLEPVPLGIALGLFAGKPLGVLVFGALAVAFGLARLPDGITWPTLAGVAVLCGIGFTMSLFVSSLAFEASREDILLASRLGILAGTTAAAFSGWALLRAVLPRDATAS
jgi:NhaA family Na+:H+ antiporter